MVIEDHEVRFVAGDETADPVAQLQRMGTVEGNEVERPERVKADTLQLYDLIRLAQRL